MIIFVIFYIQNKQVNNFIHNYKQNIFNDQLKNQNKIILKINSNNPVKLIFFVR